MMARNMDNKAIIVTSYWIAVAIISSVYMFVFGPDVEIAYGVLLPIGFLVMIGFILSYSAFSEQNSK